MHSRSLSISLMNLPATSPLLAPSFVIHSFQFLANTLFKALSPTNFASSRQGFLIVTTDGHSLFMTSSSFSLEGQWWLVAIELPDLQIRLGSVIERNKSINKALSALISKTLNIPFMFFIIFVAGGQLGHKRDYRGNRIFGQALRFRSAFLHTYDRYQR